MRLGLSGRNGSLMHVAQSLGQTRIARVALKLSLQYSFGLCGLAKAAMGCRQLQDDLGVVRCQTLSLLQLGDGALPIAARHGLIRLVDPGVDLKALSGSDIRT